MQPYACEHAPHPEQAGRWREVAGEGKAAPYARGPPCPRLASWTFCGETSQDSHEMINFGGGVVESQGRTDGRSLHFPHVSYQIT